MNEKNVPIWSKIEYCLTAEITPIGDVRAKGLFWAVELVKDRAAKTPDPDRARAVVERMRDHGVLISRLGAHDNVLKIRPPLPFDASHASLLLETLDHSLAQTRDA